MQKRTRITPTAAAAFACAIVVGCGGSESALPLAGADSTAAPTTDAAPSTTAVADGSVIDPGDGGDYVVDIDPSSFTSRVDHPFAPKLPGTTWIYEATSGDGDVETITVEVLDETRTVMGVETIVVHDVVTTDDGVLVEDTYDWFAQDDEGNVWYFGEDTKAYDADGTVSEAGAWEAGVDGALPGIVMPASPEVSDTGYRQEYLADEAEDVGQIISRANGVVVTRDWTPLEADVVEEKTYVEGVGFVYEAKNDSLGPNEHVRLTGFTRT